MKQMRKKQILNVVFENIPVRIFTRILDIEMWNNTSLGLREFIYPSDSIGLVYIT